MQVQSKVSSYAFHARTRLLTVGFTTGIFAIYELPSFTQIHSLSISQRKIDSVAINSTGEWIAFGCAKLGQLLVWEWQSESHVLKQQGHSFDMSSLAYSPDGQYIATGGDDGRVKLWNTQSGFSFVTFSEHQSGVSALEFAKQGQVVFSASLDGTVRAYDLIRYRNFKTFASPTPVQFGCLAVDSTGDIVCAGSIDTYDIYMWSVQSGKLLDVFSGHKAPVSSLAFSPIDGTLASASWDKSVRVWSLFSRDTSSEPLLHDHEIVALAYRPDGRQICASTLDGQLHFWDVQTARLVSSIEGRKDIGGGRKQTDRVAAANIVNGKAFTTLCYTADGASVIGGGTSKYICIYDVATSSLLKRFQISSNQSLDGMQEFLSSKNMTLAGPLDLIDDNDHSDLEDRLDTSRSLPGVRKGDPSLRQTRPEARTKCVRFSPTSRSWAAATTEGLLIYSLDRNLLFDPFNLDLSITAPSVLATLAEHDFLTALVMSLRLGEYPLTLVCYNATPLATIPLLIGQIPTAYLERLVKFMIKYADASVREDAGPFRLGFHLAWVSSLLSSHAAHFKDAHLTYTSLVRGLHRSVDAVSDDLSGLYFILYFCLH